jgi:hypothetical protein
MERKFIRVETHAVLRGRPITSSISAPRGIRYEEYQQIDRNAVRAFGNEGTRTIGTFADGTKMRMG